MPLKLYMQLPLFPLHLFPFKHFSLAFPHFPNAFALYLGFCPHKLCTWPSLGVYSRSYNALENTWETALFLTPILRVLFHVVHFGKLITKIANLPHRMRHLLSPRARPTHWADLLQRDRSIDDVVVVRRRCCCCSWLLLLLLCSCSWFLPFLDAPSVDKNKSRLSNRTLNPLNPILCFCLFYLGFFFYFIFFFSLCSFYLGTGRKKPVWRQISWVAYFYFTLFLLALLVHFGFKVETTQQADTLDK